MRTMLTAAMVAGLAGWAGASAAQDAAPQEETMGTTAAAQPAAPQWFAFSRADDRSYLIDMSSIQRSGEEATVWIARVPKSTPAGDYSHTQDHFGVRCDAAQSHVVESADVAEDGEARDVYSTDEPWEAIADGGFDEAIKDLACGVAVPTGRAHPSIKAYYDAGRP